MITLSAEIPQGKMLLDWARAEADQIVAAVPTESRPSYAPLAARAAAGAILTNMEIGVIVGGILAVRGLFVGHFLYFPTKWTNAVCPVNEIGALNLCTYFERYPGLPGNPNLRNVAELAQRDPENKLPGPFDKAKMVGRPMLVSDSSNGPWCVLEGTHRLVAIHRLVEAGTPPFETLEIIIPDSRLANLLREQLEFLRTSAREFDGGNEAESKRLATTLRVLFHNTNHSKSLFHQLGMEGSKMLVSPEQFRKQELLDHVFFKTDKSGSFAVPRLDKSRLTETTLKAWWDVQIVHSYPPSTKPYAGIKRIQYTRKDVILAAANKDGGAHVDPTLEEFYKHLAAEGEGATEGSDANRWGDDEGYDEGPEEAPHLHKLLLYYLQPQSIGHASRSIQESIRPDSGDSSCIGKASGRHWRCLRRWL